MKKKYLALILAAGMVLSMSGCKKDDDKDDEKSAAQTQENGSSTDDNEDGDSDNESDNESLIEPAEPTIALTMLDKLPDYVTLGTYDGIEYDEYSTEVKDEEITNNLRSLCMAGEFYEKVDRAVEDKDIAYISFSGKIDGETDDNLGSGDSKVPLEIGSGSFIEGFEEGLIGHKAGEEVVLNLTFPADYKSSDYANKEAEFTVKIDSVNIVPEFTDEFIKENFGKKESELGEDDDTTFAKGWSTLSDARKDIKEELETTKKTTAEDCKLQDVVARLVYDSKFSELPQDYIDEYFNQSIAEYENYAQYYSMETKEFVEAYFGVGYDEFEKNVKEYAQECVKEDIVMWAVAEKEGIELTDEEYEKRTTELFGTYADSYGYTDKSQFIDNNGGEDTVRFRLRLIITREWINEHAKKKGSYDDRTEYAKTLPWNKTEEN